MRRTTNRQLLIVLIAVVSFANAAHANERIELFSDEALTSHTLIDDAPRIVDVYVAHFGMEIGTTGCAIKLVPSAGFTGVWLGDTSSYIVFGDSQAGITVLYNQQCFFGSTVMFKARYQLFGTSTCSSLHTASQYSALPYCDHCFSEYLLPSSSLSINCPLPTQPTTWGRVKALYR